MHSRGVIILTDTLDLEVKKELIDKEGRFIILDVMIQNPFLPVNVYAPNKLKEQCLFFKSLNDYIALYEDREIVMGGDLNIMINPDFDGSGGNLSANHRSKSIKDLEDLIIDFELCDIWRLRKYSLGGKINLLYKDD